MLEVGSATGMKTSLPPACRPKRGVSAAMSVGATGTQVLISSRTPWQSCFALAGEEQNWPFEDALFSRMLSSDVSAAFDPPYAAAFEKKNAIFGKGIVLTNLQEQAEERLKRCQCRVRRAFALSLMMQSKLADNRAW